MGRVVVAFDATKDRNDHHFQHIIDDMISRGDMLNRGDTISVFGVLHKVSHPFGYQMHIEDANIRAMEEDVEKKLDIYIKVLQKSAEDCKVKGVIIEVKITCGTPLKNVVLQESTTCNVTWLVIDRHLSRDVRFYQGHVHCKLAVILDNLTIKPVKLNSTIYTDNSEVKIILYKSKSVLLSTPHDDLSSTLFDYPDDLEMPLKNVFSSSGSEISSSNSSLIIETKQKAVGRKTSSNTFDYSDDLEMPLKNVFSSSGSEISSSNSSLIIETKQKAVGRKTSSNTFDYSDDLEMPLKNVFSSSGSEIASRDSKLIIESKQKTVGRKTSSNTFILCTVCGITTKLNIKESMRFSYSEIHSATNSFSNKNFLGEGGFGEVYQGRLNDGQIIAAKVLKGTSSQGFAEFASEIYVLSFARHRNIMILLGYCCTENVNILVYEYICNKSLEWHLFDKEAKVLEWKQRCFIAIGTAKGLRFLHEECRSSPIIHRDLRPSNILLTHDFVPMLGDFGLAKWKINDGPIHTRILGALGYVAPEYAENGVVSVKTDVYAYGIVLIQLITGRKAISSNNDHHQSLRQWAEPLVERLAFKDLVDPYLGDSYDYEELYRMVKTAYLCVKVDPENRPSMGEVVQLLEGKTEHLHSMRDQFIPHFSN